MQVRILINFNARYFAWCTINFIAVGISPDHSFEGRTKVNNMPKPGLPVNEFNLVQRLRRLPELLNVPTQCRKERRLRNLFNPGVILGGMITQSVNGSEEAYLFVRYFYLGNMLNK